MALKLGQWSLQSLLIATAVIPFLIFTLAEPNQFFATIAVAIASLTWSAMGIVALIDTGERRAFAIGGFLSPATYAMASLAFRSDLDMFERNWHLAGLAEGFRSVFIPFPEFYHPNPANFSLTVQAYNALMLVLIGGYFARWVYRRRKEEESRPAPLTMAEHHD